LFLAINYHKKKKEKKKKEMWLPPREKLFPVC